ncbi:hypothetical protein MRX96_057193 [Rhipicephalus microplus]
MRISFRRIEQLPPDIEHDHSEPIQLTQQLLLEVMHNHGNLIRRIEQLKPDFEEDHGELIRLIQTRARRSARTR